MSWLTYNLTIAMMLSYGPKLDGMTIRGENKLNIKTSLILIALISIHLAANADDASMKMHVARDDWQLCVANEVKKIDDGISPASDIATAVQSTCQSEFKKMLDTMALGSVRHDVEQGRQSQTKELAIRITLMQRANKTK